MTEQTAPSTPRDARGDPRRAPELDLGALPQLLGFHLRLAQVAFYRDFAASLAHLDLTQKQVAVLQIIEANPGVSQVDVAAALGTDRATMMAIVDRLEDRGLLARERSAADRRRQELKLTLVGAGVLAEALDAVAEHEARFKARFSDAELEALTTALRRIHQQA
ncbi:MAG TPA: MarR family transcriptional regulator [Caulobacteraceae bacterium]|nr:MarR family transcriptional regulator [Caulobacteraceae bacterium]